MIPASLDRSLHVATSRASSSSLGHCERQFSQRPSVRRLGIGRLNAYDASKESSPPGSPSLSSSRRGLIALGAVCLTQLRIAFAAEEEMRSLEEATPALVPGRSSETVFQYVRHERKPRDRILNPINPCCRAGLFLRRAYGSQSASVLQHHRHNETKVLSAYFKTLAGRFCLRDSFEGAGETTQPVRRTLEVHSFCTGQGVREDGDAPQPSTLFQPEGGCVVYSLGAGEELEGGAVAHVR